MNKKNTLAFFIMPPAYWRPSLLFIALLYLVSGSALSHATEYTSHTQLMPAINLTTPVSGVIQHIYVTKGQIVKRGEKLLALDLRGFKAKVLACESELVARTEQRKEARQEYDRNAVMYEQSLLAEHKLQISRVYKVNAEADYQQASSHCVLARQSLEYAVIRAPIDGLIIDTSAKEGEVVSDFEQAKTLLKMVSSRHMRVEINVRGEVLDSLRLDQQFDVALKKQSVKGRVVGLSAIPAALKDPYYNVTLEIVAPDGLPVRAGYIARITIQ